MFNRQYKHYLDNIEQDTAELITVMRELKQELAELNKTMARINEWER